MDARELARKTIELLNFYERRETNRNDGAWVSADTPTYNRTAGYIAAVRDIRDYMQAQLEQIETAQDE